MAIRTYRIGTPRDPGEGLRLGTVRFLPRGVPATDYAARDLFDVWLPILAPAPELMKSYREDEPTEARWRRFAGRYSAQLKKTDARQVLRMLALLSKEADVAVGCYCEDESRCHRSVLIRLLEEAGAEVTRDSGGGRGSR